MRYQIYSPIHRPGPEAMKKISCTIQLSLNLNMLINVKMPTIVGILTFISMINTKSESLKASKHLFFYKPLKFHAHLS